MKNYILVCCLAFFIMSCDDEGVSDTPNNDSLNLDSYVLSFASGNVTEVFFSNGLQTGSIKNDEPVTDYDYDGQGRMTRYKQTAASGFEAEYRFNYDGNGRITTIEEYDLFNGDPDNTYIRNVVYDGNTITSNLPKDSSSDYTIEFVMASDTEIDRFTRYEPDGSFSYRLDFTRDAVGNYINVRLSTENSGSVISYDYGYNYDDQRNPVEAVFNSNFLAYMFIYGRIDFFSSPMLQLSRTFGPNNITTTDYPPIVSEATQVYFQYNYNNSGYPETGSVKRVQGDALSYDVEFFYE